MRQIGGSGGAKARPGKSRINCIYFMLCLPSRISIFLPVVLILCGIRFGIEFANPLSDQESSTQAEGNNTTLSEGFHWESFPDDPSGAHRAGQPARPHEDTTFNDSHSQILQEPLEQPGAAQEGCSSQTVPVKMELNFEDENGDRRANSKRKHSVVSSVIPCRAWLKHPADTHLLLEFNYCVFLQHDGISDKEPSGKKKKTKSNKGNSDILSVFILKFHNV